MARVLKRVKFTYQLCISASSAAFTSLHIQELYTLKKSLNPYLAVA